MQKHTIQGNKAQVARDLKSYQMNNRNVEVVSEFSDENEDFYVKVVYVTPYSQEELQEIQMYGDPEHEEYLCSEDYESDCRNEQWDWLKNEC